MKHITKLFFISICLILSNMANAAPVWSGCHKITAVSDYRAYNASVYLTVYPKIAQCGGTIPRMRFMTDKNHATFETVQGAISLGSTALVTGKSVQFYYDNSDSNCYVRIIALGGYSGQCK